MTPRDAEGLGLRAGTLALCAHDPRWALAFDGFAATLTAAHPDADIQHIGSTAVPGLRAKPILDIGVAADPARHAAIASWLLREGWIDRGPRSGWLFMRVRDDTIRTHNLHLYAIGDRDLADQVTFRDRLRADKELRQAYAAEKQRIIDQGTARKDYAEAKTGFIRRALDG